MQLPVVPHEGVLADADLAQDVEARVPREGRAVGVGRLVDVARLHHERPVLEDVRPRVEVHRLERDAELAGCLFYSREELGVVLREVVEQDVHLVAVEGDLVELALLVDADERAAPAAQVRLQRVVQVLLDVLLVLAPATRKLLQEELEKVLDVRLHRAHAGVHDAQRKPALDRLGPSRELALVQRRQAWDAYKAIAVHDSFERVGIITVDAGHKALVVVLGGAHVRVHVLGRLLGLAAVAAMGSRHKNQGRDK